MSTELSHSLTLTISASKFVADGIRSFELRRRDGGDLPEFTPGAHLVVRTPNGSMRKYSLCNDPAERDRYVIAVLREVAGRGGSASMVDDAKDGDDIEVSEPRNDFPLVGSSAGYTFIAGGIGITPIMSMIRSIKNAGGRFRLYYCTRTAEQTAFLDELRGPAFRGLVTIHHDGGDLSRALDLWPALERPIGQLYCCGPRGLMAAVRDMSGHWSPSAVHFEAFTETQKHAPDDKAFRVRLVRSGITIDVPADNSILDAIRAAGHRAASSCESGTCGTCRTRLIAGDVEHRDLVLADGERTDNIMICVSRSRGGEIAIDL